MKAALGAPGAGARHPVGQRREAPTPNDQVPRVLTCATPIAGLLGGEGVCGQVAVLVAVSPGLGPQEPDSQRGARPDSPAAQALSHAPFHLSSMGPGKPARPASCLHQSTKPLK